MVWRLARDETSGSTNASTTLALRDRASQDGVRTMEILE